VFGTLFIRAGGNVADLQRIMGHRSVTTTMLYVHASHYPRGRAFL
jgi:site-specific recombinase XerD